jgi:flagellar biosynthesis chaperone FliJ
MKQNGSQPFRYSLEPILKKTGWETQTLKVEETQSRQVKIEKETELGKLKEKVTSVETEIRKIYNAGTLDPRRLDSARLFLKDQHQSLAKKHKEVETATQIHEQVLNRLVKSKRVQKGFEDHKDRKELEHRRLRDGLLYKELDDLWVTRQSSDHKE